MKKIIFIFCLLLFSATAIQAQTYTYYGYALSHLNTHEGEMDELTAVVTNIVRFNSVQSTTSTSNVELKNAFTSFYDAYYDGYLKMGWSHTMTQARVFTTEAEAIKSRNEVVGKYGSDEWNVLLIKNFTMNDRGDYIRLYEWSKGRAPKKKSSGSSSSSSNKSSEKEKDKPVYVAVNKFTGQRVVCSNAAELREWEAKFAKDNQVADRVQTRQAEYRNIANNQIRQGADRQSTLQNSAELQKATTTTYGTTHSIRKAGEQLGNLAASMVRDYYEEKTNKYRAKENQKTKDEIKEIQNDLKTLSNKAQAGNVEATKQLAQYYAEGYTKSFYILAHDPDNPYNENSGYNEEIVFIKKDAETAYDLYQLAFVQKQDDETAFEIGKFCCTMRYEASKNNNTKEKENWDKESKEWFETALYLSDKKYDICMRVCSETYNSDWYQRAYDLSEDKVKTCLRIGTLNISGKYKDEFSKRWDELAYSHALSQTEKDEVCEKIGRRYGSKGWITEAEKWYAKSSRKQSDATSFFLKAKANINKESGLTSEGVKWYKQGIEETIKNGNYLDFGFHSIPKDKNKEFELWLVQLLTKDATGHIAACMVKKHGGVKAFGFPQKGSSSGKRIANEKIANATPWVMQGIEKDNLYCQFIVAYSNVKGRLNRMDYSWQGNNDYKAFIKQKPEESFKMFASIVEKKDSVPKYYLDIEDVDKKRNGLKSYYSIYTCSMFIIADMYEQGVGVKKNLEEAARWRKLAIAEYHAEQDAIKEYKRKTSEMTMDLD